MKCSVVVETAEEADYDVSVCFELGLCDSSAECERSVWNRRRPEV